MVITKELVLKIKAKNRDDVFKQISETLFTNDLISKKGIKNLVKGFKAREAQFSTGMGGGLAIPHSKCKDAKEPKLVLARLEEPVEWGETLDGAPVDTALAIIVPEDGREDHFEILVNLSKSFMDENTINIVKTADDNTVVDLLNKIAKQ